MTGKIVNLNKTRKARARAAAKEKADRNAVLHGLPKSEKTRARAEAERAARLHDASRRAPPSDID